MVQTSKIHERHYNDGGSLTAEYTKNVGITSTNAFVTYLDIDLRAIRKGIFTLYDKTNNVDYEIWVNPDRYTQAAFTGTAATDYEGGWIRTANGTLTAGSAPTEIEITKTYSRAIVLIKSSVADSHGVFYLYFRGET